jgi:hypothetical protein
MPKRQRTRIDGIDFSGDCPICIMEYEAGEEVAILACHKNHILHKSCYEDIKKHYATNNKDCPCPVCRVTIDHPAVRY